jgi:predicted KAP-like P-loop ATPase
MDTLFHPDTPIFKAADDRLGRIGLARSIARQILLSPVKDGFVVGLLGPWGTGKSSILNLVEGEFAGRESIRVIRFNPWLVSGTAELATRFFGEVGSALTRRKEPWSRELGRLLESYGELLLPLEVVPLVGAPWAAVGKAISATGQFISGRARTPVSLEARRDKIREVLRRSAHRIVFVLDDIDRLHDTEIAEVMRLVRLVGDFPNCVYLLAFDQRLVAKALEGETGDGQLYLEKILQVVHEVPPIRRRDLGKLLMEDIDRATRQAITGPFDQEHWQNLFPLGVFPLFNKVRDIRRYINGLVVTLEACGEEVALADVLALEAIRTLKPDVFCRIPAAAAALTTPASDYSDKENAEYKRQVQDLIEVAGDDRVAIEQLVTRLFPATQRYLKNTHFGVESSQRWGKERRVAHERALRYYLERSYPADTLTNARVQELFESLGDAPRLRALMRDMTPEVLEHALERLLEFEEDYPADVVEPALVPLFAQLPRLSTDPKGFVFSSPEVALTRVIYRLLKRVQDESTREGIIQRVYDRLETLRAKRTLVLMAGNKEGAGHGFVSEPVAKTLEATLTREIAGAGAQALASEDDLIRICYWVAQNGTDADRAKLRGTVQSTAVVLALLRSGLREAQSRTLGDVAIRRDWRLPWKTLERLVGARELVALVNDLPDPDGGDERALQAVALAKRYAQGWRPEDKFGLDD